MSAPPDLDAIRARADKAKPGPWALEHSGPTRAIVDRSGGPDDGKLVVRPFEGEKWEATADFIAHAREDIPALLAEIERLRKALERLASQKGFEGAGWVGGDSLAERELRARGTYATDALAQEPSP